MAVRHIVVEAVPEPADGTERRPGLVPVRDGVVIAVPEVVAAHMDGVTAGTGLGGAGVTKSEGRCGQHGS